MTAVAKNAADLPRHIAIIMDGNGRWAKKHGLVRINGHKAGTKAVTTTIETCIKLGISSLTLFAFSSENWRRPQSEVSALMDLLGESLVKETPRLHEHHVRVKILGNVSGLNDRLQNLIAKVQELTAGNTGLCLNIALNYGGRWDIVQACRKLALKVRKRQLDIDDIDEEVFNGALVFGEHIDLLIRTGGEHRLSNFLLWQCAYSEFYVTNTLWPDFTGEDLLRAIDYYQGRERRFGMTSEQVKEMNDED